MDNLAYAIEAAARDSAGGAGRPASYSISELSKRFSLTMRTLRFYEEKSLLMPTRRGNRRVYSQEDFDTLSDIVQMKALGLRIADIQAIVALLRAGDTGKARALALETAAQRSEEIDGEIAALREASRQAAKLIAAIEGNARWFRSE